MFKNADYFKTAIEKLKSDLKPFHFVITREVNITKVLNYTDIEAVIEDYSFTESADNGYDIVMDITLREYRAFGAVYVEESGRSSSSVERTDTEKKVNTYTVVSGDSLWKIAKRIYGDGSRWREIFNANKDKITNSNFIKVGMVLNIP